MKHLITLCAALFAVLVLMPSANAVTTFSVTGSCDFKCSDFGLSDGGSVSARIDVTTASIVAGGSLTLADLVDFSVTFGTFSFDKSESIGLRFEANLNGDASALTWLDLAATDALHPNFGKVFGVASDEFFAHAAGNCSSIACNGIATPGGASSADESSLEFGEFREISTVPLPATAWVFGAGLIGLGWLKRRKNVAPI